MRDAASTYRLCSEGIACRVSHDLALTLDVSEGSGGGPLLVTDASDQDLTRRLIAVARSVDAKLISLRTTPADGLRRTGHILKRLVAKSIPLAVSPWTLRYGLSEDRATFFSRLQGSSGLICGRYHAVCFALAMRIPFVAIEGNARKMTALLQDAGLRQRLVDIEELERVAEGTRHAPSRSRSAKALAPFSQRRRQRQLQCSRPLRGCRARPPQIDDNCHASVGTRRL